MNVCKKERTYIYIRKEGRMGSKYSLLSLASRGSSVDEASRSGGERDGLSC